ncbi:MAG: DUF262 domain-containing protein [Terriglobales bacterium]|jgi:hypothetical protein
MNEFKTEKAVFNAEDFLLWQENKMLEITPKFQRRSVWRTPARSYFIDTLLRDMTVPPLYFRIRQNPQNTKAVREVVDGQQRVRSVLEFIADDGYRLSKTLNAPWKGKRFSQLTTEQQRQIMSFGFPSEMFKGISDQQVLEVFCRLNMNGIPLNKQELRNGKFFGLFKQLSFALALAYLEFWRKHRVFTEQSIARMLEVELASELLIAGNSGMQDKKTSINDFYEKWEDSYPEHAKDEKRFNETMSTIAETFTDETLADSDFRRPPLFYTLYCVVFHRLFGLPSIQRATPKKRPTVDERDALKQAVVLLSEKIVQSKDPDIELAAKYKIFVAACGRQTDNVQPRKIRFDSLYDEAF